MLFLVVAMAKSRPWVYLDKPIANDMSLETLPHVKLIEREHHRPADKQSAVDWARLLIQRNDWVILDTETTGLDEKSEVIQIAILSPDNEVLLNTYVKPINVREIPAALTAVHGISMKMLAEAPLISDLLPKLEALLEGKLIVCFNAAFDIRLLKQTIAMSSGRGNYLRLRSDCAMEAYSKFAGEWSDSKLDYKWQKLPSGDHSALGDCRATLAVIRQMANCAHIPEMLPATEPEPPKPAASATPSGNRPWLVPVCLIIILALALLLSGGLNHKSEAPVSNHEVRPVTQTPVASTNTGGPADETTHPLSDSPNSLAPKTWNPIDLPDDLKAVLVIMYRPPDGVDFQLDLSGLAIRTQAILDRGIAANLHLLDKEGKTIVAINIAGKQWVKDTDGNLSVNDSVKCSIADYGRISAWEIQLAKVVLEPSPPTKPIKSVVDPPSPPPAEIKPTVVPEASAPPTAPDFRKRPSSPVESQRVPQKLAASAESKHVEGSQTPTDRFSKMEQEIFGASDSGAPALRRLERLEMAVFRLAHPQDSVAVRLDRLQQTLYGER